MAIEALLGHLETEAAAETSRLRAEAEEAAAAIVARAEKDAARQRELHLARVAEERRTALERHVASARAEARARFLAVRERALDRVLARASTLLAEAPASRYAAVAGPLALETLRYLDAGAAELVCPADVAPTVTLSLAGRPDVSVRPTGSVAGVLARSPDGRVVVDNTLPALLARRRGELLIALAARLEGAR